MKYVYETFYNMARLCSYLNEHEVRKEDIVMLYIEDGLINLIYVKWEEDSQK